MANHLASETSPYLRQHAGNPVEWYPWGDAALERARREDRPILLSIGYAACHWCHVMAHESFEDPATAAVMNEHFVNIKVDREERPDLDSVYMQAVQAMTGHGGWPMTVFLTPKGEPFYGGTYFPPEDRHGMPSFTRVLLAVADSYTNRRDSVTASAESIRRIYDAMAPGSGVNGATALDQPALERAHRTIASQYDPRYGGFGSAPKFPPTMQMDFLLRHWARTGETSARDMAHETFLHMARGGICDQIGGGFARYSVDERWLVPHFEKMLYDNVQIIQFGSHLWQATKDSEVRRVVMETVDWISREMTAPEGGFYSSLDADSEGEEGKFYVWDWQELTSLLGDAAPILTDYWGVARSGNFEGKNILHRPSTVEDVARRHNTSVDGVVELGRHFRELLYDHRARRVWPSRDEKVVGAWNGLALRAIAEAARTFGREDLPTLALRNADFLRGSMVVQNRVARTFTDGRVSTHGFLDDQAAVALGFLGVFELTLDTEWLVAARDLAITMLDQFWDDKQHVFFDTSNDSEELITRPHDPTDNAVPSGTSLAVELLLRLAAYDSNQSYRTIAERVMSSLAPLVERYPSAFGHLLSAAEFSVTFACHGDFCDMPSPRALELATQVAGTRAG